MKKKRLIVIAVLCIALAAYEVTHIVRSQQRYKTAENTYTDIATQYTSDDGQHQYAEVDTEQEGTEEPNGIIITSGESHEIHSQDTETDLPNPSGETEEDQIYAEPAPIKVDFAELKQINPDIVGWIYCEGTKINYPVMRGETNDTYLHHMMDGTYNFEGCIFIDSIFSGTFEENNTIIYGHSMNNGDMFGSLRNYSKQEYYEAHPVIWLLTPNGDFRLDLAFGFVIDAESELYQNYADLSIMRQDISKEAANTTFDSGYEVDDLTHVVFLSTCSKAYNNARYFIVAQMIPCGEAG